MPPIPKKSPREMAPVGIFVHWISEREKIRLLKDEFNRPKPWTGDPILQAYRFCNVVRMEDKVSQWLMKNWYVPFAQHPNGLIACGFARFFNLPETLALIQEDLYHRIGPPDLEAIRKKLKARRDSGKPVFNGAYMIRGFEGTEKIDSVIDRSLTPLIKIGGAIRATDLKSMEDVCFKLEEESEGIGSFLAGQIVCDLRWHWSSHNAWLDRRDWAPIGPGSRRGMNRFFARGNIEASISDNVFKADLAYIRETASKHLSKTIVERMEAIDWQNCLCEFDKYCRVLFEEGRPKQRYLGKP